MTSVMWPRDPAVRGWRKQRLRGRKVSHLSCCGKLGKRAARVTSGRSRRSGRKKAGAGCAGGGPTLRGRPATSPRWRGASRPRTEARGGGCQCCPLRSHGLVSAPGKGRRLPASCAGFPPSLAATWPRTHAIASHPVLPGQGPRPRRDCPVCPPALLPRQPSAGTWRRAQERHPRPRRRVLAPCREAAHLRGHWARSSRQLCGPGGERVPISAQARQEGGPRPPQAPPTSGPAPTGARGQPPARPPHRRGRQETRSPLRASPGIPPARSQRPGPRGLTASPGTCNSSGLRRRHRPSARASMRPTGPSPRDYLSSPPEAGAPPTPPRPSPLPPRVPREPMRNGGGDPPDHWSPAGRSLQAGVAETRVFWT